MPLLNEGVTAETRRILAGMRDPVRMACFTEPECHACGPMVELATEVAALSPLLRLETRDRAGGDAEAARLGVDRVPALTLAREGADRWPVRYYGLPAGHEFGAFLQTLLLLSTGKGMPGIDAAAVAPIVRPSTVKVFVLPSCPRCPVMVYLCNSIAAASPLVTCDVVDASAFPDLASRFQVGAVPKVVINETVHVPDVVPAAALIEKIAAAPPV